MLKSQAVIRGGGRWAGGLLLSAVTLVFLASIGGGMLYVWWALVPLHWWASAGRGPVVTGWWAFLAAASLAEVAMMLTYVLTHSPAGGMGAAAATFVLTGVLFVRARARTV